MYRGIPLYTSMYGYKYWYTCRKHTLTYLLIRVNTGTRLHMRVWNLYILVQYYYKSRAMYNRMKHFAKMCMTQGFEWISCTLQGCSYHCATSGDVSNTYNMVLVFQIEHCTSPIAGWCRTFCARPAAPPRWPCSRLPWPHFWISQMPAHGNFSPFSDFSFPDFW